MRHGSEQALAAVVVRWLEEQHWTVYQEVTAGGIADIVAVQDRRSWVIECKMTFGLDVLAQASDWKGRANWCSVAVPHRTRGRGRGGALGEQVARWLGVGVLLEVDDVTVREEVPARLWRIDGRRGARNIRDVCNEGHRTHAAAGASGGGRWTPFRQTCENIARLALEKPGITVKELVASIEHHYSTPASARAHLPTWIEKGIVDGVRLERDGRALRLYPR